MQTSYNVGSGYTDLDEKIQGIRLGDNVVWQVDSINDYIHFVLPYVDLAKKQGRNLIYFRFADHAPLLESGPGIKIFELDSSKGFESFSTQIHNIIKQQGLEALYVFDCLSDVQRAWATDLMIGNFFIVTCPYLFELQTVAYFAIYRNRHSYQTVARIRETTQLLLDIYHIEKELYVHPLKVWNRYSPTMFLPHKMVRDKFVPVTSSMDTSRLFSYISSQELSTSHRKVDHWDRIFMDSHALIDNAADEKQIQAALEKIINIMITRDSRMAKLAIKHFDLQTLLNIKSRLIGTGYIGGKAAGMLLARAILANDLDFDWQCRLEAHDSFYIGSDVFYSYIIQNNSWYMLMDQKTPDGYFSKANLLRDRFLEGEFPPEIKERFYELIEYFGQSPIIVRSSSLLEDSFGHAFAGKYESFFLVNQGTPEQRYLEFESAVKKIYASTMNENALTYRLNRGLDKLDEQMALLVQRVSGSYHKKYFFPFTAGVGVTYNTFVWDKQLSPEAGMIRIVLGLGTRAVDRVDDDYPRLIAMDKPLLRPTSQASDLVHFSQRKVDVLDVQNNKVETIPLANLINQVKDLDLRLVAQDVAIGNPNSDSMIYAPETMKVLTFDSLFLNTDFIDVMSRMFEMLELEYKYPLDIEFTMNYSEPFGMLINLLQCRPLQTKAFDSRVEIPSEIKNENMLFTSQGGFLGGNVSIPIDKIIYVPPAAYIDLPLIKKYELARMIGKVNQLLNKNKKPKTLLIGPGRWGTTTPSLGVPINFAEISKVSVICELSYPKGNLMPELSFGSHFFQDLVESEIFYCALFTDRGSASFDAKMIDQHENMLTSLLPEAREMADVLKVCDVSSENLRIMSDVVSQKVVCFFS